MVTKVEEAIDLVVEEVRVHLNKKVDEPNSDIRKSLKKGKQVNLSIEINHDDNRGYNMIHSRTFK